ncbi:Serine carboxypeptidase-like 19 [Dichanthelium oligosanthes]|uniref:Serine carboxypeptidase-like 19 n=1 Tax=Dichanthelium oligosanthes TaxID=888268 RepID=A0A1E5WE80_9POAL|nr:Serine carboxypeptidase-like 19 [Dichanthelium oligosanthes]
MALQLVFLLCLIGFTSASAERKMVTTLPGFDGVLPFTLETGYVTVDKDSGTELFYYFIQSEGDPRYDPVLLWLTGGDRCTVLSGIVLEIGPVKFIVEPYNGSLPRLQYNPYSWTKAASILFVDSPVGAGFSFSRNPKGYNVGDVSASLQLRVFLRKWFTEHPSYLKNNFYIGGDSYAGKIVPFLAQKISEDIEAELTPNNLNLKGYLVGNPITGESIDTDSRVPFAHGMGIISDQLYKMILVNCGEGDYDNPRNTICAEALTRFNKVRRCVTRQNYNHSICAVFGNQFTAQGADFYLISLLSADRIDILLGSLQLLGQVHMGHVLYENCNHVPHNPSDYTAIRKLLKEEIGLGFSKNPPPRPPINCTASYSGYLTYFWGNSMVVQDALGIKKGTIHEWVRCHNGDLPYSEDIDSSIKYHNNVTSKGYRALVYSGDHDAIVPFLGTQTWVRCLNFSTVDSWRAWHLDGQSAGFTITYSNNMTFATVKVISISSFTASTSIATMSPWRLVPLVFLLGAWSSFSPCSHLATAAPPKLVTSLPGFDGPLPFHLETGYVGVDEENDAELFYYFVESEGDPGRDPVLLWLTGGDRCSVLSGLAFEIGPFKFVGEPYDGGVPRLEYNPYSWSKVASVLFVDWPVGAGFSFSKNPRGYEVGLGNVPASLQLKKFLTKWFIEHPDYLSNPFYVGADSYSGKIVPFLAQVISEDIEAGLGPHLNLQVHPPLDPALNAPDDSRLHWLVPLFDVDCNIERHCFFLLQQYKSYLSYFWANNDATRDALGIKKGSLDEWVRCHTPGLPSTNQDIRSSIKYHRNVTLKGYRSLVYSGDHDIVVPFLGTQAWVRSLNYTIDDDWRAWLLDGQSAGFTITYSNNLTFATIKGGGHTAPEYQPERCFAMIQRWISRNPL